MATAGTLCVAQSTVGSLSSAARSGDRRIKVGQIGTRHGHAAGKMDTVRKYPDVFDVVGVVESDATRRQQLATSSTYKDLPWMTEQQLLNVADLELVLIETEIGGLLSAARQCVMAGKHIHLDKPAGDSLPLFKEICAMADERQVAIQMGYMFRSNPAFRFLFKAVREGWLGDVFSVHCEMSKKVGAVERKELAVYPGGSMFELGCHLIDAVVSVLGKPNRVTPFLSNSRPEIDSLMDNCQAVFEYDSALATVKSAVCEVQGQQRRQFVVCGSKGTVNIFPLEPAAMQLTLESATAGFRKGTQTVQLPKSAGRYDGDLLHLANVVRKLESHDYNTAHDIAVQETLLKACGMKTDD